MVSRGERFEAAALTARIKRGKSRWLKKFLSDSASTSTLPNKPDLATRFVKAMEDSYCYYSNPANLDSVVTIMQRYAKVAELSDAEYKAMVKRIIPGFGPAITARTIDTWARLLVDQKQLGATKVRSDVIAPMAPEQFTCGR